MNRKTTLILLIIVGLLVAAFFIWFGDESPLAPKGPGQTAFVFPGILFGEVTKVTLQDPSGKTYKSPVDLVKEGETWFVTSRAIMQGRKVRARLESVRLIVDMLQDMNSFSIVDEDANADPARYGLQEGARMAVTVYIGDGKPLTLHLGVDYTDASMLVRRADQSIVHEVPRDARVELFPALAGFWDRRLIPLPILATSSIHVKPDSSEAMELVREFSGWRIALPREGRADMQRCDVLRNNLMNVRIESYADESKLGEGDLDPRYTVTIKTKSPDHSMEVLFCAGHGDDILVRVPTETGPVLVKRDILEYMRRPASFYRDRRINRIAAGTGVASIRVERQGTLVMEVGRDKRNRFTVIGPRQVAEGLAPLPVDPEQWNDLFRKLNDLQVVRFEESKEAIEAQARLIIVQGKKKEDQVTRELAFGKPDGQGVCRVRIAGQPESALIRAADIEFLFAPWYEIAERRAGQLRSWFKIARIRIKHRDGRGGVLTAGIANGRMQLFQGEEPSGRELPFEMIDPLVQKIGNFTVDRFVGEALPDSQTGFDDPEMIVEWQVSPKGSQTMIPLEGSWESFRWGKTMGGTHAYVSLSRDPKLACDCAIDDLGIFNRVLDWLIQ